MLICPTDWEVWQTGHAIPGHPRPSQVAICCHEFSRMSHEAHPFPAQGTLLWCRGGREAPGPEPILTLRQAARGGREVETDGRWNDEMTLNETAKSAWTTALTFWKHGRDSGVLHFHMSDRPARWLLWISLAASRAIGGFGAVDLWDAKLWLCNSWKAIPRRFAEGFVERWALTDGCHGRQTIVCHSVEKFNQIIPAVAHCGPKHNKMLCTGMLFWDLWRLAMGEATLETCHWWLSLNPLHASWCFQIFTFPSERMDGPWILGPSTSI